jgi:hypothetical protein
VVEVFQRSVRLGDHPLQQREQHCVFGREVKVERRAGDADAVGQVIDRNISQRPLLEQAFSGREDRSFAVIPRRAGAAPPVAETAVAGGEKGHDSSLRQILTDYQ